MDFPIFPSGAIIDGIEVLIEGKTTGRDLAASLWNTSDGADAYTSPKTADLSSSDTVQILGGPTDKWGKTWTSVDFADATFKVKIDANSGSNTTASLDQVQVKVYYNAPIVWPTSWTTPNSCVTDPSDESPDEVDLVGSSGTPAVGFASDANYQYFRERVDGNPGSVSNLHEFSWVVLFQTSTPQYQYLGTISGKSDNKVLLYDNPTHSPDSGGVDFSPLFNDPADNVVWEGASSDYGRVTSSGGEYYIDWAIPVSELTSRGIDVSTTKFFATSTNANNYNKDHLQCYEAFADLSIVKSDSPDPVTNGGTLTYTLAIHNGGPDTASSVIVNDTLPTGFAVTSVTPSVGSCSDISAPTIQCELGNMVNGADATITIVGTITTTFSSVTNTASVDLDPTVSFDPDYSNNTDSEDTSINQNGTIIVHKDVQGPNGEDVTDASQNFSVQLDGGSTQSITDGGIVTYNDVSAGTHTITESVIPTGYSLFSITPDSDGGTAGAQISVTAGQTTDVYVVNRQQATTLTLVKEVINDDGGNAVVANFPLYYDGILATSGQVNTVAPGTYTLSETNLSGYTPSAWVCTGTGTQNGSDITLTLGQSATCTITNDDVAPKLTLVKTVVNDNGGTKVVSDFPLFISGTPATSGTAYDQTANVQLTATETTQTGYTPSVWGGDCAANGTITLLPGDNKTCTITNDDVAPTITLIKNVIGGSAEENDFGLTIGETSVDSDVATEVNANEEIALNEVGLEGYTFTSITGDEGCPEVLGGTVTLNEGEDITCTITNTRDTGSITVNKIIDVDGNLETTDDQTVGVGWQFDVTGTGADTSDPDPTGIGGDVTFADLNTGQYSITETRQDGYDLIGITCNVENGPWFDNTVSEVPVSKDTNTVCTFYNTPNGTIHGYKWNDQNENGDQDGEEPRLAGWTINLYESDGDEGYNPDPIDSMVTDSGSEHFGWYWFEHLLPGEYKVCEVLQDGWQQTYPDNDGEDCHFLSLPDDNSNGFEETQNATFGPEYNFGNHFIPPVLQISKSNDSGSPETPGNDVVYTITVTAPESNTTDVEDVKVTDLPPAGFEFVSGSDVASQGSLTSAYASPGVWSLGTMSPGQVITLSYRTTISGSQDAGNYEDLAFAQGNSVVNETDNPDVTANDPDDADNFVGTDVEVVLTVAPVDVALTNTIERNVDTKTIHKTKRVLGAATILPSTGSNINTILSALMLLLSGLILLLLGKRSTWLLIKSLSKSMSKAVKVSLFIILGVLFISHSAYAANLNVQIETPKSPVSDPNFKIGFVVLDIDNGTPAVTCRVDDGSGFADFPVAHIEYTPQSGGNSGNCVVDAVVMPTDGTYKFLVKADAELSNEVTVKLISGTPSTPLNYSRAAGSCTASFTTANDGLTDKVELYRSLSSTFTADASTLVTTSSSIGPNVASTLTDTNGDCGGSYFYAIRAVALSGLGSGFVGDESVVIDNEHKVKTKTTTKKVAGPVTTLGAIPVTGGETEAGAVEGAATAEEISQPSEEEKAEGAVLGSATEAAGAAAGGLINWIKNHPWWSLFWLLIIFLIAYFARRIYLGNYNENNQPR